MLQFTFFFNFTTLKLFLIIMYRMSGIKSIFTGLFLVSCLFSGCTTSGGQTNNELTKKERKEGWELLFDGTSFKGWRILGMDSVQPDHWKIENGMIRKVNNREVAAQNNGVLVKGGDLMTADTFGDFELYFEWKIKEAGNSGIKYNVSEELSMSSGSKHSALGFEYQILDDDHEKYKGKLKPSQFTGSLYDLIPAQNTKLNPIGEFNNSRIIFKGNHGEHWLNGIKVVEFDISVPEFESALEKSKFVKITGFADKRKGHIVITDHSDDSWYRNIKIRRL